jgi:hypothetical protein
MSEPTDIDRLNAFVNAAAAIFDECAATGRAMVDRDIAIAIYAADLEDRVIWGRSNGLTPRGIMHVETKVEARRHRYLASLSAACGKRLGFL